MTILGIDPALNRVGYGILTYDKNKNAIIRVVYGVYDIDQKDAVEDKLNKSFETTQHLIKKYNVDEVVIEKVFYNPKKAKGGMIVREAIGALKVAVRQAGKPVYMYSPQTVKKTITGNGAASKVDMAVSIARILDISQFHVRKKYKGEMKDYYYTPIKLVELGLDHISDALSISYCRLKEVIDSGEEDERSAV